MKCSPKEIVKLIWKSCFVWEHCKFSSFGDKERIRNPTQVKKGVASFFVVVLFCSKYSALSRTHDILVFFYFDPQPLQLAK